MEEDEIKAFDENGNPMPISDLFIGGDFLQQLKMSMMEEHPSLFEYKEENKELNYEEYKKLTQYLMDKKIDLICMECIDEQISFSMMSGEEIVFLPRMDYQNIERFFKGIRDAYFENKKSLEASILLYKGVMFKIVERRLKSAKENDYSLVAIINKVTLENNTYQESLKKEKSHSKSEPMFKPSSVFTMKPPQPKKSI